ncbi:MAG TPA: hypothetical protein DEG76_04395 [Pseudohongiella sp.]|nr:hypothetical protein [Pseudohongiella sp.]HBX36562.1 hypothetical protein [Pseudohongiella sp.]|tara:strand:+ start:5368 stop:5802 length:435 start_codon:yes stop_codon:yes gene_type:complete
MDKFSALLSQHFDTKMPENFEKRASYYSRMDFLEYVCDDTTVVAERIDGFLTVLLDADDRHLVGFRLKGFGYAFKTFIQPAMKLESQHFDPIIFALTRLFTDVGNALTGDDATQPQKREEAYKQVVALAQRDQVSLPADFPLAA